MAEAAQVPKSFDRAGLEAAGFIGWSTWDELCASKLEAVPHGPGAYVVSRSSTAAPAFLPTSPAGHFKGKDPSVPTERLMAEWVDGATIIYIGKADVLRRRLQQFA